MPLSADELAAQLREDIRAGRLPVGSPLPSIRALAEQHGVGRGVAQQSIAKLREEGLIASRHGSGSYVQGGFGRTTLPRNDLDDEAAAPASATVIEVNEVPAASFVADALGIAEADPVVRRRGQIGGASRPRGLQDVWLPAAVARGSALVYHDLGAGGLVGALGAKGLRVDRIDEDVVARKADGVEGDALALRVGSAVIEATRVLWSAGVRVALVREVLDADVYALRFTTRW